MSTIKKVNIPSLWIFSFLWISQIVICIDKELPSFIELPPPIQYYTSGESSIELKCNVWPSSAKVQFMVSSKKVWSTAMNPSQNAVELNLLDRNIGDLSTNGRLKIMNPNHLTSIQDLNIHCLTATDFATILSRPFRVNRAEMSEFGGDITIKSKTTDKRFLRDNVAIIDCWPPESHPRAEVKFNLNDVDIKEGGKYRIIHWSDGKRISLLIHPARESDNGLYRCIAMNPITRQTKLSSDVTNLIVEKSPNPMITSITVPMSGRANGPQQIVARKGTNVTLFCVMQGSPAPKIKIYNDQNDLTSSTRYSVDSEFGLLTIRDVQLSDGGSYMCTDKSLTSHAMLKVVEPLNITTRPENVVLDNLSASAVFKCVSSKPSIVVQWFFNGRTMTGGPNGTLLIQTVTMTNLGIYQCVAQDHDEWVSAAATLSIKSYNLISQPSLTSEQVVSAPLVQNVDKEEQILSIPLVSRIHDNMAVFVKWKLHSDKLGEVTHFVLQYESKGRFVSEWTSAVTIMDKINVTFHYVTSRYVQPQHFYRFRVHTFFINGHTLTSNWSKETDFMNVGSTAPVIEESSAKSSPGTVVVQWTYHNVDSWPVNSFRILYRQALINNDTKLPMKFDSYFSKDVAFPTLNVTIDNLEPGSTYQITVYGINDDPGRRTITKYSEPRIVSLPARPKIVTSSTPSSMSKFWSGLWDSWNTNKLLYGSLFALTGFLILVMFLLLLLCLCRQRRFRNNKDTSSTHTFPYAYKEVSKSSVANNNNSSTLQLPGRMPQYSSQLALQQFQPNNGSIERRSKDNGSQMRRAGSSQAMDTASLVTDIYSPNYIQMGHMQHPYQGFSTLPQGYPNSHLNRNNQQYQHYLQQQQQQQYMGSMRRENPAGDSNRDSNDHCSNDYNSVIDQSMEMPSRNMSASQQQLMLMQCQEQQRANMGYYNSRSGAMSPQMMMMMGSQQSLVPLGQYRRSNSQNYQGQMEAPIAISAQGHPLYQMDLVDSSGRPISPQYQYMQQQQQQQQHHHQQQQQQQAGQLHPSMMDMYNQSQGYVRPTMGDYSQHSLYRQQYRRSDSDCGGTEPGYAHLPTGHHCNDMVSSSRQHTLNSLPEQPVDVGNNNNNNNNNGSLQQQDSPGNMATNSGNNSNNNNNNSSGRHHHRRKTRSRQQNMQDNLSLERAQGNQGDLPPMLAPRSKVPYPDHQNMRLSGHDMAPSDCQDASTNDGNSDLNVTGDQFEPPLQYSTHYDPHDANDNEVTGNNSLLIENLPRIRDVSEYGIPVLGRQKQRLPKQQQQQLAPVPPLKAPGRHAATPNNGYNMDCNADYYSSATSSDRSGPSPPPKYAPSGVAMTRPDEVYMKSLYYHGDTHC